MSKSSWAMRVLKVTLMVTLALSVAILPGCSSGYSENPRGNADREYDIDEGPSGKSVADDLAERYSYGSSSSSSSSSTSYSSPIYDDPDWPTNNVELNAIPESQRWYNASSHVGTRCTIVGPVSDVYQASESNGRPIFVHIGNRYPDCVSLVIWEEAYGDFSQMLTDVGTSDGSWISVTGYLSSYEGNLQFNIDDGVTYTWWTNVR